MDTPVLSQEAGQAPGVLQRARQWGGRLPFAPIGWPARGTRLDPDRAWPEWAALAVAVLFFARGADRVAAALTAESARTALFSPLFALLTGLLGMQAGAFVTLVLGLFVAASGMWWLGFVLGMGAVGRVWAGAAYALAGGLGAGLALGRLGLDLGGVWLPWMLAFIWMAVDTRRPRAIAAAALAVGMTLLGGDGGLALATLAALLVLAAVAAVTVVRREPAEPQPPVLTSGRAWRFHRAPAALIGLAAALGLGLAAIYLLPGLAAPRRAAVEAAGHVGGGLGALWGGWAATSAPGQGPYAFFGLIPFLLLGALPLALSGRSRRPLLGLGLIFLLGWAWAAGNWLPQTGAGRAWLAWCTAALFALAGLGLDAAWRWCTARLKLERMFVVAALRWAAAWLGIPVLAILAGAALLSLYQAARPVAQTGAIPIAFRLSFGDAVRFFAAQSPILFAVGLALFVLAAAAIAGLFVLDARRYPRTRRISTVAEEGELLPLQPLDLPDGTPVMVELELPVEAAQPAPAVPSVGALAAETPAPAKPAPRAARRPANPWQMPGAQAVFLAAFAAMVGVVVFLRFYKLDWIQREFYGDIAIVRNYVDGILVGHWPTRFDLSAGPLYHYLITPVAAVFGIDYLGLKIASVVVSLLGLAAIYAFARRLVDDRFALLTTFIAGVSSWLLVFSRLGNSHIILPLLTAAALYLVLRVIKFGRRGDTIACAVVSCAGLFVYPQSFVLPVVIFVTLVGLRLTGHRITLKQFGVFIAVSAICAIPFILIFRTDVYNFTSGYIGGKINPQNGDVTLALGQSIEKTLLALHVRGDETFRSNPAGAPHLDLLSGVLFLFGMFYWLSHPARRRLVPLWLVPLILLQTPAILALNQPREIPSASRTLGISPVVYLLVASGILWLVELLRRRGTRPLTVMLIAGVLLAGILGLNVKRYFGDYVDGLPYHDTPIARLIVDYVDSLPANTQTYMVGCCWEASIPDRFLHVEVKRPKNLQYLDAKNLSCPYLQGLRLPAVFIWSFRDALPAPQLDECKQWLPAQLYTFDGRPTFTAAPLLTGRPVIPVIEEEAPPEKAPAAAPGAAPAPAVAAPGGLERAAVTVGGQPVAMAHSRLDMGEPANIFDGDVKTLMRGNRVNPLVIELQFAKPRPIAGLSADFGHMDFTLTARLYADANAAPKNYTQQFAGIPDDPHIEMAFPDAPPTVSKLRLEILQLQPPNDVHIHVREIKLK